VWRLTQKKSIASAHIVMSDPSMESFMEKAKIVTECLHAYGIHSATLQPELDAVRVQDTASEVSRIIQGEEESIRRRAADAKACQISCGNLCEELTCCG
jgi:solute carrier family 30 (zinc transporter), member 1